MEFLKNLPRFMVGNVCGSAKPLAVEPHRFRKLHHGQTGNDVTKRPAWLYRYSVSIRKSCRFMIREYPHFVSVIWSKEIYNICGFIRKCTNENLNEYC